MVTFVSKVGENELVILGGDLSGHVSKDVNGYDGIHRGFGYGVGNLNGERILEIGSALDMVVSNMLFKKRDTRLIIYISRPSKTQIDYIMVRNKDTKRVREVKVIAGEEVAQQHQLLICDIMICAVKEFKKPFVPKMKVWRLNEDTTRVKLEN